jgi:hypothetical protein
LSRRVVVKFDVRPKPSRGGFCFDSVRRHDAVTAAAAVLAPRAGASRINQLI